MAEHMLILKLTSPEGEVKYVTGAFPSACGKTNLAMLIPTLPDWKVETVGDDIAWMKFGEDGRLYAVNPEAGFFGVAPEHQPQDQPERDGRRSSATRSSPTARKTDDGDIWWEGMTGEPPAHAIDWHGNDWTPESDEPAAHPNARFTTPAAQCPVDRARVGGPGRRADRRLPLRRPPRHRRAAGPARRSTGSTASSWGRRCPRRRPRPRPAPSASCASTRWRCCRSAATTWPTTSPTGSKIGKREGRAKLPRVFYVNWFRKDADGKFLWPGFGENSRVLEWVFRRCDGEGEAVETPIGLLPAEGEINTEGLDISAEAMEELLTRRRRAGPRRAAAGRGAPRPVRRPAARRGPGPARRPEGEARLSG